MSRLIRIPAVWDICPSCERHACIVLSDGVRTKHFGSQEACEKVIDLLVENNKIDLLEAKFLRSSLSKSRLFEEDIFGEMPYCLEDVFPDPEDELEFHSTGSNLVH